MRRLLLTMMVLFAFAGPASSQPDRNWSGVLEAARGQTVRLWAIGSQPRINAYIAWAADHLRFRFGVTLEHVHITGPAALLDKLRADRVAERHAGQIDLAWVDAATFAAMQSEGLLAGPPWAEQLPNSRLVDGEGKPALGRGGVRAVDGLAVPWGLQQLSFYFDSARMAEPPRSLEALQRWAEAHPGRFTYPSPDGPTGAGFLKQVLLGLVDDSGFLYRPAETVEAAPRLAPLWAWLDRLHPKLWQAGTQFPVDPPALRRLFVQGEVDLGMTFNPGEASAAIAAGDVPATVRSFVLDHGSLGSAHFLVLPFNGGARGGSLVVADFLLSPEAQARKADDRVWGDPSVLAYGKLDAEGRALFDTLSRGPATLAVDAMGPVLAEPHPEWTQAIVAEWQQRYRGGA